MLKNKLDNEYKLNIDKPC